MTKPKAVIILGPTGVGKSDLAIKIAKTFDGEIISADSVQIYKGLDIGSAKVMPNEMQGIVHHCIDILPADAEFSVYEYVELTKKLIREITARGHLPIIVGGTGLYVKALIEGYDFGGSGKNQAFRDELWTLSGEQLHERLMQLNPLRAQEISPNDKKKLIRAIEIASFGIQPQSHGCCGIVFLTMAITLDRQLLYDRINKRVDIMISQGLENEVKSLQNRGLTKENQSMKAIGYKEMLDYLSGQTTLEKAIELIKQHSRNYAKRQMTFLRGMKKKMFDKNDEAAIMQYVRDFYDNNRN